MKAIAVKTKAGDTVLIEVDDTPVETIDVTPPGGGTIAGTGKAAETIQKLQEVGTVIADVCRTLQERIESSLQAAKPSELTLEFGVKLAGETGIPLVTKGSIEGTFQVTAKWDFSGK